MNGNTLVSGAMMACGSAMASSAAVTESGITQGQSDSLRITVVNLTAKVEGRKPPEGADARLSRPGDLLE